MQLFSRKPLDFPYTRFDYSSIAEVLGVDLQKLMSLNDNNVFNVAENCHYNLPQGSIVLSESQCVHELEKARLLLQEKINEISYLKNENIMLKDMINLLKSQNGL